MKIIGNGGHAAVVRDVARFLAHEPDGHFIAVGDNRSRQREARRRPRARFVILIHPWAYVAPDVKIGAGTIIMAGAIVQPTCVIGRHVIVNTNSVVEHHCRIGDFVHIGPGAHLCGGVKVGTGALIGVGVGIAPGAKIPAGSLVKARRLEIEPLPGH